MGDNIPQELFQSILHWLVAVDGDDRPVLNKRELGGCSRVCRYWAAWCRPHIFHEISLRNGEDILLFNSFMKTNFGEWNIGRHIKYITFEQSVHDSPWAHFLLLLAASPWPFGRRPHLSLVVRDDLTAVDDGAILYNHYTIPGSLPRSLRSLSIRILHLKLDNICFNDIPTMLRCLSSRPCRFLTCRKLSLLDTSNATPLDLSLNALPSSARKLDEVSIYDCQLHWPFVLLLLRTTPGNPRLVRHDHKAYINEVELPKLLAAMESILANSSHTEFVQTFTRTSHGEKF
jgi:hypothetical protein